MPPRPTSRLAALARSVSAPSVLAPSVLALAALFLTLTACANIKLEGPPPVYGREPVERSYQAPGDGSLPVSSSVVAEPPAVALDAIAKRLTASGFTVTAAPAPEIGLVVERSGDPEPYLDCGSFMLPAEDGRTMARVPAARLQVRIPVLPVDRREAQLRQIRLDARVVVLATPMAGGSELIARSTYAVTRTVDRVTADGRVTVTSRDTIAFGTNDIGRFEMGLECVANGRLEALLLGFPHP